MSLVDDGSTSPTLLRKVADWEDHPAWVRFRDTYDHRLRLWCSGYELDADSIEEVCQRIWIELADRMRTFEYDPSRSFRGWLRRLCECRVLNFLRKRRATSFLSLDERDDELLAAAHRIRIEGDESNRGEEDADSDPLEFFLLDQGEAIQAAVRARVKAHNWEAFWLVAVQDWSVEQTAQTLGMTRVAVYAARERVARMLREEGRRASHGWEARNSG